MVVACEFSYEVGFFIQFGERGKKDSPKADKFSDIFGGLKGEYMSLIF